MDKQSLDNLLANLVASSAIENETRNVHSLRSSLANRLGETLEKQYPSSDRSEGLADIMLNALKQRSARPYSKAIIAKASSA